MKMHTHILLYQYMNIFQYFLTSVPLQPEAPGGPGGPCKPGIPCERISAELAVSIIITIIINFVWECGSVGE